MSLGVGTVSLVGLSTDLSMAVEKERVRQPGADGGGMVLLPDRHRDTDAELPPDPDTAGDIEESAVAVLYSAVSWPSSTGDGRVIS